jgi:ankyrin repeat protein
LVDAKASVNRVNDDEDGYAPVVVAIWKQHADVVSLLLERKANLDTIDGGADSPLDVEDHLRVALALVDAKADANAVAACSQERRTPLAYAAECGYGSVVMLLIRANADANEALQHPPVRQLVEKGRSVLVRLLRASKKATKKYAPTQYILSK